MTQIADGLVAPKRDRLFSAASVADFVALAKPRITLMVLTTTLGGLWLARPLPALASGVVPAHPTAPTIAFTLLGTALIVAGANALNMFLERDVDGRMARTKNRPLPAGRMSARVALWFGVVVSVLSVPILAIGVNPLTALLAVLANLSYVLAYTPLKQRSHLALWVGAVPGAIPPLLGWTAATGRIDAGGLVLFAVLFLWQIPHFLAIAVFRRDEYAKAGLMVTPNVTGIRPVKHAIVRYLVALVAASLLLVPLGIAHRVYLVVASILGACFFAAGCLGLTESAGNKWARGLFAVSIVYLVLLFAAIVVDA